MGAAVIVLLAVLTEVGLAQVSRRLVLTLFTHAGNDQHDNGDHVGQHVEQLLSIGSQRHAKERHVVVQIAEHTE